MQQPSEPRHAMVRTWWGGRRGARRSGLSWYWRQFANALLSRMLGQGVGGGGGQRTVCLSLLTFVHGVPDGCAATVEMCMSANMATKSITLRRSDRKRKKRVYELYRNEAEKRLETLCERSSVYVIDGRTVYVIDETRTCHVENCLLSDAEST